MKRFENLVVLKVPHANSGTLHLALIQGGHDLILVDAGFPGQLEEIKEQIERAGLSLGRLTGLVFTHQDLDHIGSARDILAANPGITTMAHESEAEYIEGTSRPAKIAKKYAEGVSDEERPALEERERAIARHTVKISRRLKHGELLDICGGIEIIHVPGHTPGHICLLLRQSGLLISGDALNISEGRLTGPNPVHTMDMDEAKTSLKRLLDLPIKAVLTYHGGLFEGDVKTALEAIISGA